MIAARLISLIVGYFMGSFQTGYFYGKTQGIDIREHGSGNSGTTNTLRTLGMKAGAITFAGDLLKVILAILVIHLLFRGKYPENIKLLELYAGFGCVLGHNFPFYLKFRGGKGIACTSGVVLAVAPPAVPVCLVLFFGPLLLTHYVSLSSLLMVSGFLIQVVVFCSMGIMNPGPHALEFELLAACFTAMAFWRHRSNIQRLIHGNENKLNFKKQQKGH